MSRGNNSKAKAGKERKKEKEKKLEYAFVMMHERVSHKRSTFIITRAFNEAAAAAIFPLMFFLKKRAKKWGNEEVGPHKKGTFPPFSTCCYLLPPSPAYV